jgi:hypothetical protein
VGTQAVLTRTADADTPALLAQMIAYVSGGVANIGCGIGIGLTAAGIVIGTTALVPFVIPQGTTATETARALAAEAAIAAALATDIAAVQASLITAATLIFANVGAAEASALANGAYFYIPSAAAGGALDLYIKVSGVASTFVVTIPSLNSALNAPSLLQHAGEVTMAPSLGTPSGIQYAAAAVAAYTLTLPAAAPDGAICGFTCTQAILAFTVAAADGATIYAAPAALFAAQPVRFEKKTAGLAGWYPTSR